MSRNKVTPAAYLILKRENKIFLTRRANTHYFNGFYSLPAGHVEDGELPSATIIREAKEEVGVELQKENVQFAHALYRSATDSTGDRVDYFFTAEKFEGEPKNCEPEKCDDAQWFDVNTLPENVVPEVRHALKYVSEKIQFSEMPFDKKNLNPDDQ